MNEITIALVFSAFITLLIVIIEIIFQSKTSIRFCATTPGLIYLVLMLIGNLSTTLVAVTLVNSVLQKATPLPGYTWFWYSFIGVFGFEAVLQNINITFLEKGVLSLNTWLTKARDSAVASVIRNAAYVDIRDKQRMGQKLFESSKANIHTHALSVFGDTDYKKLIRSSGTHTSIDIHLYLALALAHEHLEEAKAIIKAHRES